ncbi:LLM class flavin-dependent oxidoreductase [Gordonia sp. (in: high G+C Gram-positive bacteria)]|uniref:LLM class flavin-dependent oxidoreductase n=1 Tax=Gordonia sp. (in: high G+C Gram-positive bacteria) TaxID=84139 RepID=UPI002FD9FC58
MSIADTEYLWYIPNQNEPGHRGDTAVDGHNSLDTLTEHALALERNGWQGALIGTSWGRPDTFTVATALAARTSTFEPLIAVRPGYWRPANFASSVATLDHLSGGRVRINIVSGKDNLGAYGDGEAQQADRYDRTREFIQIIRRLWTEENLTYRGEHFSVENSTAVPRIAAREGRPHPKIYFGGASEAAERGAAAEADVQLFWGEPLDGVAERIDRLKKLSETVDRQHAPLEFGLRITTFIRDTTDQAWEEAQARVVKMAESVTATTDFVRRREAVGQRRLFDLASRGEVLDDNLYTTPGKFGGGGAGTTWLVGSAEDVAKSLRKYADLGITQFVLSDTPYLREIERQGTELLPLLRD